MRKLAPVAFLFGLLSASSAFAAEEHCVFLGTIDNFQVINGRTLVVYTGPKTAYRVDLFGLCPNLSWAETIAIDSPDGRLCWNSQIMFVDNGTRNRCQVDRVYALTPDELQALKSGKK